jgi:hypothetical protein
MIDRGVFRQGWMDEWMDGWAMEKAAATPNVVLV